MIDINKNVLHYVDHIQHQNKVRITLVYELEPIEITIIDMDDQLYQELELNDSGGNRLTSSQDEKLISGVYN